MEKLPYETLSEVVKYFETDQKVLVQLNQTCKKLYDITLPCLYRSPQFATFNTFESFANSLDATKGSFVRHIDLHMVPHRWDSLKIIALLSNITEKTPDLELLNLDLCYQLTNKAIKRITSPLHDLRVLSLDQCALIGDEGIESIIMHCPYIQKLYLGGTHVTDKSLNLIATKLILLTHLFMPACEKISEEGINILTKECKTLQYIDIRECYNVVGHVDIPSNAASALDTSENDEDVWEDTTDDEED